MPSALGTVISVRCWPHQPTYNVAHSTCSASRCPRRQACKPQDNLDQRLALKRRQSSVVEVPVVSALSRRLHLEQIARMDLAPVFADVTLAETVIVRWDGLHARDRRAAVSL